MENIFSSSWVSFSSFERTTQTVKINGADRVTVTKTSVNHLPGFSIGTSKKKDAPLYVRITYNPLAPDALKPGYSGALLLEGKGLFDGETEEEAFKAVIPVEVAPITKISPRCKRCLCQFSDIEEHCKPLTLPCGHFFCLKCIKKAIGHKPTEHEALETQVSCMTCSRVSTIKPADPSFDGNMMKLLEKQRRKKEQRDRLQDDRVSDPIVPCYEDHHHESALYCESCVASFCKRCYLKVHDSKIMSHHAPIPVDQKPIELPKCLLHPEEDAVAICEEANCKRQKIFCEKCRHQHKGCQLSDMQKTLEERLSQAKECLEKIQEKETQEEEKAKEASKNLEAWMEAAKKHREQIGHNFDKKKDDALVNFDDKIREMKRKHFEMNKEFAVWRKDVKPVKSDLQKSAKRKADLFFSKPNEDTEQVLSKRFCWEEFSCPIEEFDFTPGSEPRPPAHNEHLESEENERNVENQVEEMQHLNEEPGKEGDGSQ